MKKQKHRKRTTMPCEFSVALKNRIEEFVYQLYARGFARAEKSPEGSTPEGFIAAMNAIGPEEGLKLFHEICDPKLICPKCGAIHGTIPEFQKNLALAIQEVQTNLDVHRLRRIVQSLKE